MNIKKANNISSILNYLEELIVKKKQENNNISYTEKLLQGDINKVIQKVGEETVEVLIEATLKNKKRTIYESADLIYHLLVMWNKLDISLEEIAEELEKRKK
tara:strand:- start:768 stop:1073 length:306 start_codon:yes stop_codon:yes gene_type:complete